ncbi:methyl-accepting chemotaxis protein [Psychromonas sp. 14N.309.X.WAT.B.A12]|uniref:methyl-accepting chemotaxis protein n=1 Tax=unclassified Psychromonas TaxID=2614957 RepID=UPI0025B21871|nr:methyl-accepting chemotaxis protein [Psychromonas sp. 14N.309.X.WAT.B.A12]MDN2662305.1 methyl-accepting chemotaxis protein [Psychromonas sp. 14N.309.X.WAT.B.A12]
MRSLSIKNRIILSILLVVVVSTSVIALVAQLKSRELLLNRLQNSELPNLVQRVSQTVDAEISEMKAITKSIANNPFIYRLIDNNDRPEIDKRLTEYLSGIANSNNLSNASYIERNSAQYWNQKGFLRVLQNNQHDSWYFKFKNSGKETSASTYTESDGTINVFVNYQQLNGRGSSGVSRTFSDIATLLQQFKIEQTGFVYLVDQKGLIKVHKNRNFAETKNVNDIFPELDKGTLFAKQSFAFQEVGDYMISTSYIESLQWYIIAQVPKSELYEPITEARNYMLILFLIIVSVFVGLSIIVSNKLVLPLQKMAEKFQILGDGEGDLTSKVDENGAYEIAQLAKGFNSFVANIRTVVHDVKSTSTDIRSASETVYKDANASKLSLDKQRDEAHQVSVAINEMGSTIAEIANNAAVAADTTNKATDMTSQAQIVVNESTQTISHMAEDMEVVSTNIETLAQRSDSISSVLDVIRGISEQTNLLALNAAIEAARAGEYGRGFAVVADEVRNLAKKTHESTDEIHRMITELQDGSKLAVDSVHKSREQAILGLSAAQKTNSVLNEIVNNVQHISDLNTQIATATEEQSAVINEINVHVVNISDSTEESAHASQNIESSTDLLKSMAASLDKLVNRFKS